MTTPETSTKLGPCLFLKTEGTPQRLPLAGNNCWTVGRNDDNSFVLGDRWISRNHAMIQCMDSGEFYLIDLGSRNGSFLNGRRVSVPVTLHNGDAITFGQTELNFYCPTLAAKNAEEFGETYNFTATAALDVRRLISVLVVDIRDYTVMTRQLNEEVLSEAIGTWFRYAGEIIGEYGSWVDKYIGDAVMAVWIHGTQEVTPQSMCQIATAISELNRMTGKLHEEFPLPFPLRIGAGLNTGYAMVGNSGSSSDHPDYTPLGDTVNAAFRFESSTKQLGLDLSVGETTYKALEQLGVSKQTFKRYAVDLKGYDQPLVTHGCAFSDLDRFLIAYTRQNPQ
ncbi:MAG: adenylate/guanylate cyclase domain-containing protein [Phormidesmis priestleyi]|uniref:Adenylate/guanylate cyclase domain-containing protein n=1 Tax=Phormidesmis priestleyi TaxID=268141 RepID=A0A2W4YYX3_9CYAN|nr:MAG: adenylate/guanylate cyclase domain-containing protein [Phormidesmis priestleyi]